MTADQLELLYLLPPEANALLCLSKIQKDTLIVDCATKRQATRFKRATYRVLLHAIAPRREITSVSSVRYRWGLGRLDGWELPLYYTD